MNVPSSCLELIHIYIYMCVCVCMNVCMYVRMYVCVCMYIYIYICVCVNILYTYIIILLYIYIYIRTNPDHQSSSTHVWIDSAKNLHDFNWHKALQTRNPPKNQKKRWWYEPTIVDFNRQWFVINAGLGHIRSYKIVSGYAAAKFRK